MLVSRPTDNPSGRRYRHAECAGGSRHASIERDERCVEPLGDGDVQRVRRAKVDIQTPQSLIGRPDIGCRNLPSACGPGCPGVEMLERE